MVCKGICVRFKAVKSFADGRYESGQRRCKTCEIFIKFDGVRCPCCGSLLRTKPRNKSLKAKLLSPDCVRY